MSKTVAAVAVVAALAALAAVLLEPKNHLNCRLDIDTANSNLGIGNRGGHFFPEILERLHWRDGIVTD